MTLQSLPALQVRQPNMGNAFAVASQMQDRRAAQDRESQKEALRRNVFADPGNRQAQNALAVRAPNDPAFARLKEMKTARLDDVAKNLLWLKNQDNKGSALAALAALDPDMFDPVTVQQMMQDPAYIDLAINRTRTVQQIMESAINQRDFDQMVTEADRTYNRGVMESDLTHGLAVDRFGETLAQNAHGRQMAQGNLAVARGNANTSRQRLAMDTAKAQGKIGGPNVKDEGSLRKEFSAQTKEFQKVDDALRRAVASKDNAVGDVALIFSYMKMLDPGSVVREGEFATAQQAQGVPERVMNLYNQALTGERLTPGVRSSMKDQAQALYQPMLRKFNQTRERYNTIAGQYRMDPRRITYQPQAIEAARDAGIILSNSDPAREIKPGAVLEKFLPAPDLEKRLNKYE